MSKIRSGWTVKKVHEKIKNIYSDRWYLKSPKGNYYMISYCNDGSNEFKLMKSDDKSEIIANSFNKALNLIYDMDWDNIYSKKSSDYVKKLPECIALFKLNADELKITIN